MNTPVVRHANRFSPLSAEINDEPGVPNACGVRHVVHPPGESDTDSAEFHAIHTPAGSDGGEEGDDDTGGHSEPEEEEVAGTFDPPLDDIVPIGVDVARCDGKGIQEFGPNHPGHRVQEQGLLDASGPKNHERRC